MAPECHSLLKSVCALKGVTVSNYVYGLIFEEFERLIHEDPQVRQMVLSGNYSDNTKAGRLKRKFTNEYESSDD